LFSEKGFETVFIVYHTPLQTVSELNTNPKKSPSPLMVVVFISLLLSSLLSEIMKME